SQLAHAVATLVPTGWRIEAEGRAFRPARAMTSEVRSGIDWFELHGTVDFGDGLSAALPRLLEAALARLPSVSLDERFVRARDELASFGGLAPLDPASSFQGKLRDYQRD